MGGGKVSIEGVVRGPVVQEVPPFHSHPTIHTPSIHTPQFTPGHPQSTPLHAHPTPPFTLLHPHPIHTLCTPYSQPIHNLFTTYSHPFPPYSHPIHTRKVRQTFGGADAWVSQTVRLVAGERYASLLKLAPTL